MNCPFLKETHVKFCDKAAVRKMIRVSGVVADETCSSPAYRDCKVYRRHLQGVETTRCPYLREALVQYCAASAVSQFIPYQEPLPSRCRSDSYRYCDVHLNAAGSGTTDEVGGIPAPAWLYYSPNHVWLDASSRASCHFGVDAFMTRVLGEVDRITFISPCTQLRPSAVLTIRGADLEIVLPHGVQLTASNVYLRGHPAKLIADPYGMGWLFHGLQMEGQPPVTAGLIHGSEVRPWMEHEIGRMSAFLAESWNARHGIATLNDGGAFHANAIQQLNREEILRLFHEFFRDSGYGQA